MRRIRRQFVSAMSRVPTPIARRLTTDSIFSRAIRPIVNRVVPTEFTEVQILSGPARGLTIVVDMRNEKYYLTGAYELATQAALIEHLHPGSTFWDVGAHAGFFTFLAASRGAVVHAFEPMAQTRARLEAGVRANGFATVSVHAFAIGRESGEAILHPAESSCMWSITGDGEGVSVIQRRVDDLVQQLGSPSVIKVDVEGAEIEVIRGASVLLSEQPPVVLIEFTGPDELAEARELLTQYSFSQLSERHWLLRPLKRARSSG